MSAAGSNKMSHDNTDNTDNTDNAEDAGNAAHADSAAADANGGAGGHPDILVPAGTEEGSAPGRKRWIVAAVGALAVALFTVPLLRGPDAHGPGSSSSAAGGAPVPGGAGTCPEPEGLANFNFTLKDMNGADVRLTDYKGKVVLLNFWATWCGPCKVEIPEFVEVYKEYHNRGFEILGVLSQDDPSRDDLRAFTSAFNMNYPVFRAHEDFENAHGPIWALPTTYVIDRQGSICTKHMGPFSKEMVEQVIKGLL
jgi:peroxiredoxin